MQNRERGKYSSYFWATYLFLLLTAVLVSTVEMCYLIFERGNSISALGQFILYAVAIFTILYVFVCILALLESAILFLSSRFIKKQDCHGKKEALYYSALMFPMIAYVSWRLFQGEGVSRSPLSPYGGYLIGLILLFALCIICRSIISYKRRLLLGVHISSAYIYLVSTGLIVVAIIFYWIDGRLYLKLYGYLHNCLALLTVIIVQLSLCNIYLFKRRKSKEVQTFFKKKFLYPALGLSLIISIVVCFSILHKCQELRFSIYEETVISKKCLSLLNREWRYLKGQDTTSICALWSEKTAGKLIQSRWFGLRKGMNVILITIDALRPDHMSFNGYGRIATPNIDNFFSQSVVFRRAYCQTKPQTKWSLSSLFSSKPYSAIKKGGFIGKNLQTSLKRGGYQTFRWSPDYRTHYWEQSAITDGFDVDLATIPKVFGGNAAKASFLPEVLTKEKGKEFFAWFHLFCIHEPYQPPEKFKVFGDDMIALYDGESLYADSCFGEIIEGLKEEGYWENSIIVVTADHGELLGEGGLTGHSRTLNEAVSRVPFAIRIPGLKSNIVEELVGHLDLVPTLLELTGISSDEEYYGRSLLPLIFSDSWGREELYLEMKDKKAVIRGNWKLVYTCSTGVVELYDLDEDPFEEENLVEEHPYIVEDLKIVLSNAFGRDQVEAESALLAEKFSKDAEEPQLAMLQQLLKNPRVEIRQQGYNALKRKKDKRILDFLIKAFKVEDDPVCRILLMEAMGKFNNSTVVKEIQESLFDNNILVRRAAAKILSQMDMPCDSVAIIKVLRSERDYLVLDHVIDVAGRWKIEDACPSLVELLFRPDNLIRQKILAALGRVESLKPKYILEKKLQDSNGECQEENIVPFLYEVCAILGEGDTDIFYVPKNWLLCGPFISGETNNSRQLIDQFKEHELSIDFTDVTKLVPEESQMTAKKEWVQYQASNEVLTNDIDLSVLFSNIFRCNSKAVAYAFTKINVKHEGKYYFLIKHKDGVKIYVNGKEIYHKPLANVSHAVPDLVTVPLSYGTNNILVESANLKGEWGFNVAIFDMENFITACELLDEKPAV